MKIVPITLKAAREFQDEHHRHNAGAKGHKFSVGLADGDELVGCATVGRPVARGLDDGSTVEILRVCVLPETKNGNSMLYGACVRAAKAMGYKRIITYTLKSESGASLRASGFEQDAAVRYRSGWDTPSRRRSNDQYPTGEKIRWVHY